MKKRWIVTGIAVVSLVAATAGIAFAAGRGSASSTQAPVSGQVAAAHDAMHDSPGMQAMHDQMPAGLQAECDALHEQMDQMMGSMMGGSGMSGMMGGSAGTSGSIADHNSSAEG